MTLPKFVTTPVSRVVGVLAIGLLAGCSVAPEGVDIHDPYEQRNRAIHAFNKTVDRGVLRPVSKVYGPVVPDPIDRGIANFADNLGTPQDALNYALQGNVTQALDHTGRFVVNSTFGLLGLFDVAGQLGTPGRDTDFGETLHVWGVPEGAYVEVPFLGPSTERDTAGRIVDLFTDPLSALIQSPESDYVTGARIGAVVDTRYKFGQTIDSIFYESADSYSQSRLLYLQNRRFELGQETGSAAATGQEDDLYDDAFFD